MDIKIKYMNDDISTTEIIDIEQGDWLDLKCRQNIGLLGDPFKKIPLGVAMQLPKGYEAHIVPRSSTFKKWGLIQVNGMGVVDESYCGPNDEWFVPMYLLRNNPKLKTIPEGTRLCQFRIMKKQPKIDFKVSTLEHNKNRGGHGSTG